MRLAAALCTPSIAGVGTLAALAWSQQAGVPADAWLRAIFAFTWGSAFLGAAYGPILIPIGAALLVRAGRVDGGSPRVGWAFIVAALLATAVSYVWLLDAVELP